MSEFSGVGVYMRQLKPNVKDAKRCAKLATDHGTSFVALMSAWFDKEGGKTRNLNINSPETLAMYAAEFIARDVAVWLWGYPRADAMDQFIGKLATATKTCTGLVTGWILDPEVYFKGKRAAAKQLMGLARAATKLPIGMTSYGMAQGHKTFPWAEFTGADFGSPQLYEVEPPEVHSGLAAWDKLGYKPLVPSVPAYGRKSGAALNDFLGHFVDAHTPVHGFIVWSWPQISPDEWRVLARWADWFRRSEGFGQF